MSYVRLPYDDAETPHAMSSDCLEAGTNLHLPGQRAIESSDLLGSSVTGAPFASAVAVPESLARLAGEMELHFD